MTEPANEVLDPDVGYPPDPPDEEGTGIEHRAAAVRAAAHARLKRVQPKGKKKRHVSKRNNSRLLSQEKRRRALESRKAGMTYQQIAQAVGYNDASAARKAVMKAYQEVIIEPVAELKTLQVERLSHMLLILWPQINAGDQGAIRTATLLMDKIDRLMGTETAPLHGSGDVHIHNGSPGVLVIDGSKDDYIASLKRMTGAGVGPDGENITVSQTTTDQQTSHSRYPPGMEPKQISPPQPVDDVVDAEVLEDDQPSLFDSLSEGAVETIHTIMGPPTAAETPPPDERGYVTSGGQGQPTRRKFDFSTDPKRS